MSTTDAEVRVAVTNFRLKGAAARVSNKSRRKSLRGRRRSIESAGASAASESTRRSLQSIQLAFRPRTSLTQRLRPASLKVAGGPVYPFRRCLELSVWRGAGWVEVWVEGLDRVLPLRARGKTVAEATWKLADQLDGLVHSHRRKPLHARSDEDARVCRVLDHLIDWDRYWIANPVEQPLWGRIEEVLVEGLLIHWIHGPSDEYETQGFLAGRLAAPELRRMAKGQWFYGSGKVFPNRIEWTTPPSAGPDPRDQAAARIAWDRIPVHHPDELNAWPLRKD